MAQWITRLPTEQKIPGSSPGKLIFFLLLKIHAVGGQMAVGNSSIYGLTVYIPEFIYKTQYAIMAIFLFRDTIFMYECISFIFSTESLLQNKYQCGP